MFKAKPIIRCNSRLHFEGASQINLHLSFNFFVQMPPSIDLSGPVVATARRTDQNQNGTTAACTLSTPTKSRSPTTVEASRVTRSSSKRQRGEDVTPGGSIVKRLRSADKCKDSERLSAVKRRRSPGTLIQALADSKTSTPDPRDDCTYTFIYLICWIVNDMNYFIARSAVNVALSEVRIVAI